MEIYHGTGLIVCPWTLWMWSWCWYWVWCPCCLHLPSKVRGTGLLLCGLWRPLRMVVEAFFAGDVSLRLIMSLLYHQIRQQMEEQVAQKSSELEQYLQRVRELEDMYLKLQEALEDEKQARQDEETVRKLQARYQTSLYTVLYVLCLG